MKIADQMRYTCLSLIKKFPPLYGYVLKQKINRDFSDWRDIFSQEYEFWESARLKVDTKKKVLIATSMGGYHHGVLVESMLSAAYHYGERLMCYSVGAC